MRHPGDFQVGHSGLACRTPTLPKLFKWMGRRIAATKHLAIAIDRRLLPTADDLLRHLHASGHRLSGHMETLVLTLEGWNHGWGGGRHAAPIPTEDLTGRLQEFVMSSCPRLHTVSLSLDKAPSWRVNGPSLWHICLRIPPSTMIVDYYEETGAKQLYEYIEVSGMHSANLPNLQTLFLQGLKEPVELRGIDFRGSHSLEVMNVHDCWINYLSLPPCCQIVVSAQTQFMLGLMDGSRKHPLVSRASHVCLPTDLDVAIYNGDYSTGHMEERQRKFAMGIPDIFPAMRSLRMTWPDDELRCWRFCGIGDRVHCFTGACEPEKVPECGDMEVIRMTCLSRQWQHENLRELLIEGHSLGLTIPALPNLETLLVFCKKNFALDFVDPHRFGHTITKMSVVGEQIHFHRQQHKELCEALTARNLELVGDRNRCIAVHASNKPIPASRELLRQAMQGFACKCRACPSCLGIGKMKLEEEESYACMLEDVATAQVV